MSKSRVRNRRNNHSSFIKKIEGEPGAKPVAKKKAGVKKPVAKKKAGVKK